MFVCSYFRVYAPGEKRFRVIDPWQVYELHIGPLVFFLLFFRGNTLTLLIYRKLRRDYIRVMVMWVQKLDMTPLG